MWVYYTGTPADALLCKGVSGDGNAWKNLGIRLDDDPVTLRQINWRSRGGDTVNALNSRTGLPLAEWVHVAVTFDVNAPGNNQKIYINGKLDAENRSANPLTTNAGPLFIGAETYTQPAGRWWWQGMIDEGSLYNRALNPVEIKTIAGVKPATDPTPKNGATVSTTDVRLEWWQGSNVAFAERSSSVLQRSDRGCERGRRRRRQGLHDRPELPRHRPGPGRDLLLARRRGQRRAPRQALEGRGLELHRGLRESRGPQPGRRRPVRQPRQNAQLGPGHGRRFAPRLLRRRSDEGRRRRRGRRQRSHDRSQLHPRDAHARHHLLLARGRIRRRRDARRRRLEFPDNRLGRPQSRRLVDVRRRLPRYQRQREPRPAGQQRRHH